MKTRLILSAVLLAASLACPAEEANPFVNQKPKEAPLEASGESFVSLTEHILVPADQLDAWLVQYPLKDDAAGLRAQVQTWIAGGSAQLDHTAVSTGIAGRICSNESHREQSYATAYDPAASGEGEWPPPTAFERRDLGYSVTGIAGVEQGAMVLRAQLEYCGMMLPHHSWNELAERTRQPDDIFIPRFRSIKVEGRDQNASGNTVAQDPFAEPAAEPVGSKGVQFDPGKTYLAARADDELPETVVSPSQAADPARPVPHRMARLIFFRGNIMEAPAAAAAKISVINHISAKLIRVDHKTFSGWVQTNELTRIPDLAWAASAEWRKNGKAENITDLTAPSHVGSTCKIENCQEVSYPTEWEPGDRLPATDGKPSHLEPSLVRAFETRNVGTSLEANVVSDPKGSILHLELERVVDGGKSVHHRILRDGEWKVDMTMPIFITNRWNSELRVKQGEWMLVGSGSDIDAKGNLDPNHAVLAFVKVE